MFHDPLGTCGPVEVLSEDKAVYLKRVGWLLPVFLPPQRAGQKNNLAEMRLAGTDCDCDPVVSTRAPA